MFLFFFIKIGKIELLFKIKSMDGGRISLNQDTTGMCVKGHIPTNKFALIWVVRGDQELPSVITRGVIWHYSRVYDVDYAEAGKAAGY